MYLSVSKEVAMTVSGLVLITVSLANVLTAQAECCKCDCPGANSALPHSQLYYIPVVPPQQSNVHLEGQHLAAVSLANIAHLAQVAPTQHAGYQTAGQYHLPEGGSEESSAIGSQIQGNAGKLDYQSSEEGQSYSYGESGHLDSSDSSNTDVTQKQLSKVSTHLDTGYINIEKQIISEQNSIKDVDHLRHEHDHHHHGKNDYYKFEYGVNDHKTHDIKRHKEEKKGDVVHGEYSLVEDDGNVRTVKYYADWKTGFHAQVHNSKKTALG